MPAGPTSSKICLASDAPSWVVAMPPSTSTGAGTASNVRRSLTAATLPTVRRVPFAAHNADRRPGAAGHRRPGPGPPQRGAGHDRRPDPGVDQGHEPHQGADRRAGHHLHQLGGHVPAVLPVAGHLPQRPVRAQPPGAQQRPAVRRLHPLRPGQRAGRVDAGRRLPHDARRPHAQRLRHRHARHHHRAAGLERLAGAAGAHGLQLRALADERERPDPGAAGPRAAHRVPDRLPVPARHRADRAHRAHAPAVLPVADLPRAARGPHLDRRAPPPRRVRLPADAADGGVQRGGRARQAAESSAAARG